MTPSEKIIDFVCGYGINDMSSKINNRLKLSIIDYVGVTLAGTEETSSKILFRFIESMGGNPQSTIWGRGTKTTLLQTALAHGNAAHALDYDDSNGVMRTHPSSLILPGLFALGEYEHRSGQDLLTAYAVAFEVGAKLGRALNPELVINGWLPVGITGVIMQTVACAKLLDLPALQVGMALGIASNLASGLRCNNGTMAKHILAGKTCFNGLLACLLSRDGITGNEKAIEDRFGLFTNFSRKEVDALEKACDALGTTFDIIETGIIHKFYPSCTGTHLPIQCALDIVDKYLFDVSKIRRVDISISALARPLLIHSQPKNDLEAKFSLEYCVARAILDGKMGIGQFRPGKIKDSVVQDLINKINPHYYEIPKSRKYHTWTDFPAEVCIRMADGTSYSSRQEKVKGSLEYPLSERQLEEKFLDCSSVILTKKRSHKLLAFLKNFEEVIDIADMVCLMSH